MSGMQSASAHTIQFSFTPTKGTERLTLALVLSLHVVVTFILLPPREILRTEPLRYVDHPVHTHRVYMYRQALLESGFPWGYDPAVSAGVVMSPRQDVGAKPQQILGALLPFLAPGTVVRLFLFLAVLTFPLWTLLACRRLDIPVGAQVWVMLSLLVPAWLYSNFAAYFRWGLVSFAIASYFAPYVLLLFLSFLTRPGLKTYLGFCSAGALLFLLHILGPVAILPPLVFYSMTARPLAWRWRMAIILAPLIIFALNAFWFVPCVLARWMPNRPWLSASPTGWDRDLTYETWAQVLEALTLPRVAAAVFALSLAMYGFAALRKMVGNRVVVSFALGASFALFLKFFGSFLPVVVEMQPVRFLLPAFALLTVPVGFALYSFVEKARLPTGLLPTTIMLVIIAIMPFMSTAESKLPFFTKPQELPFPPSPDPLAEFVAHRTTPTERLLIQSTGGSELKVLPLAFGREIIGNTYPDLFDPAQFLGRTVWGRELDSWSPPMLRSSLERWGVAWVFTRTEKARVLLAETTGDPGEVVGDYYAFRMPGLPTRFLIGSGRVEAKVNRIEVTELKPEGGLIVLRYRYHPAWQTAAGLPVDRYPVPEHPAGFIALRDPSEAVTLHFRPWKMLNAFWPQ